MMLTRIAVVVTAAAVALTAFAACDSGTAGPPTPPARTLAEGDVLGKVDRTASGGEGNILTLVGLSCDNGKLIVRMRETTVTGTMDCLALPPQAAIDRVLSKQVTLTWAGGKVHIETVNGASVDVPATDVAVTVTDATPGS